ncbi:MAG TPA: hypothetical protein VLI04_00355 [Nocardioidaceae bacterium]|nr:hypothetical protein [Nocardioidaceae bacterium]
MHIIRRLSSTVACAVTTLMLLVGCGSDDSPPAESLEDPATSSSASPLEGTWQAGPVTLEETVATLRRHGLSRWAKDYRANPPFKEDTLLTLFIKSGAWDLYGESGGGEPAPIDFNAEYEIDGNSVTFHHSDGSNTYRWEVRNDELRLEFVESTLPGYMGIPDEVFQRALYMTTEFTRQD